MTFMIRKSSGTREPFNVKKLETSLKRVHAQPHEIKKIIDYIMQIQPKTTKKVHDEAIAMLHEMRPAVAARYNLKAALMQLGPAGYPFEKFIAHLFAKEGYTTQQGVIISGACVDHEVDVIAIKDNEHCMMECKFHNRRGLKSNVKVTLYVYARYLDIRDQWEAQQDDTHNIHQVWVITNTKFTSEAIKYGLCKRMALVSWAYPRNKGLGTRIDTSGLHPITALTSITLKQKKLLIKEGLVLCRDAAKYRGALNKLGLSTAQINNIIKEAQDVCEL